MLEPMELPGHPEIPTWFMRQYDSNRNGVRISYLTVVEKVHLVTGLVGPDSTNLKFAYPDTISLEENEVDELITCLTYIKSQITERKQSKS